MVRYIFDDIWCIQAGQENRVGELNCNAGSHDRQFPFISTVDSLQKSSLHFPKIFKFENWAAWLKHVVAFQPTTVVVWTNLINLNESETWWSATDSMISFCTCPLTFSSGVFQGGRKGTHTTRYYELINKYAKDSYGGENDLGLRCKRHQKHSKTCSCLFGVMVQSGYFVGKMSMIQCGQLWAMRNYAWLWPPVLLSLHYSRVRCPKPQNQAEVLLLCGLKILTVSVGKHIGVNFWRFRDSTKLLKLLN